MKKIYLLFTLSLWSTLSFKTVFGQAGSLDLSFSTDGIATDVAGYGKCVAIQSDGKIVVGGFSTALTDILVSRYNTNGTLDLTFDSDGTASFPIPVQFSSTKLAIAIQSDGKIVLAGTTTTGSGDVFLLRCDGNGALDNTFGTLGIVTTAVGSGSDQATGLKIQSDGKILVVGSTNNGSNNDIMVIRYNSDGTLDTSFDTDGILVNTAYTSIQDRGSCIAIQTDGKIVVGGYYNGNNVPIILRLNADGTIDTSFGISGFFVSSVQQTIPNDLIIQTDGKIVMSASGSDDFNVLRCNSNGSNDTGFGTAGVGTASFTLSPDQDWSSSIDIQSDGKIVLAGRAGNANSNFALARFNSNGTLDNLFDGDGLVVSSLGGSSAILDMAIQTDGKIVVVGEIFITGYNITVARYFGICPFPSNPGVITGNTSACTGSTHTYSISAVSGATTYTWSVPSGAVINSGQGSTSISVTFGTTSGNISVVPGNPCGTSNSQSLTVNLMTVLSMPGTITGNTSICAGSTNTYSISSISGASGYTWTVPSGSVINSGQGTTSISVTAGLSAGNITVTAENTCGSSLPRTLAITNAAPAQPGSITGSTTFCFGTTQTFSVSAVSGATSYTWSVPADATIISGQGTNSIAVTFGTTSGTVSVTSDNTCGSSSPRTVNVTVNNSPSNPGTITGDFTVCPLSTGNTYSIASVANATSYTWLVPSDATITSGQGTTSINVTFGTGSGFITVYASNGCGNSGWQFSPISVMTPNSFFSWSSNNLAVTFTNLSTETTSYAWMFGDAGTSAATDPVHNYAAAGTYTVELTATGPCGSDLYTTNITISTTGNSGDVGINDIEHDLMLNSFPNPTSGIFHLAIGDGNIQTNEKYLVEVFNLTGECVRSINLDNHEAEINLKECADGIYFLKCTSERGTGMLKIIKN